MMTDTHSDYFLRNKLVLLAEARGKVVVSNAACLVKCAGTCPRRTLPGSARQARPARKARRPAGSAPRRAGRSPRR